MLEAREPSGAWEGGSRPHPAAPPARARAHQAAPPTEGLLGEGGPGRCRVTWYGHVTPASPSPPSSQTGGRGGGRGRRSLSRDAGGRWRRRRRRLRRRGLPEAEAERHRAAATAAREVRLGWAAVRAGAAGAGRWARRGRPAWGPSADPHLGRPAPSSLVRLLFRRARNWADRGARACVCKSEGVWLGAMFFFPSS